MIILAPSSTPKNNELIDSTSTGMVQYDLVIKNPRFFRMVYNLASHIEMMDTREYLRGCCKVFDIDYDDLVESRRDEVLCQVVKAMKLGVKFDMPILNYAKVSQNGIHRALAVDLINPGARFPVLVIDWGLPRGKFIPSKVVEKSNHDLCQYINQVLGKSYYKY